MARRRGAPDRRVAMGATRTIGARLAREGGEGGAVGLGDRGAARGSSPADAELVARAEDGDDAGGATTASSDAAEHRGEGERAGAEARAGGDGDGAAREVLARAPDVLAGLRARVEARPRRPRACTCSCMTTASAPAGTAAPGEDAARGARARARRLAPALLSPATASVHGPSPAKSAVATA